MKFIILNLFLFLGSLYVSAEKNENPSSSNNVNLTDLSNSYIPQIIDCPDNGEAQLTPAKIHPDEKSYTEKRRVKVDKALLEFFERTIGNDEGIDLKDFVENKKITIGLSFAGNGYKGLFAGAGQIAALDNRTENKGPLAGILQASSYISGSETGNLLISTLLAHDFPNIYNLLDSSDTFSFSDAFGSNNSLIFPYGENDTKNNEIYWDHISEQIIAKRKAGFNTTIIDTLGRALTYQLLGKKDNQQKWANFTLSSVTQLDSFKNADMPYPFLILPFSNPYFISMEDNKFSSINARLEMSPYTVGSWDLNYENFVNTTYFNSYTENGKNVCIKNYDNLGYIMGMSALYYIFRTMKFHISYESNPIHYSKEESLFDVPINYRDEYLLCKATSLMTHEKAENVTLNLAERLSSSTRFLIPFSPYTKHKENKRDVDVIFIFNNISEDYKKNEKKKSDVKEYPNNYALFRSIDNGLALGQPDIIPDIPSQYDIANSTYLPRPAFFGCKDYKTPLIVYVPTGFYIDNITLPSEEIIAFDDETVKLLVENGRAGTSLDKGSFKDENWSTCVACAMINHNLLKHDNDTSQLPEKCIKCLEKYCRSMNF